MSYLSFMKAHRKRSIVIIVVVPALALLLVLSANKIAPVGVALGFWGDINNVDGVAIDGYDAVAYHVDGVSIKGDASKSFRWNDVEWHFSTDVNKSLFMTNPDQYAPQYGGYCAYAVSKGATAPTDPDAWTVFEEKLYLNFSTDVRSIWQQDKPGNIEKANANWPGVLG